MVALVADVVLVVVRQAAVLGDEEDVGEVRGLIGGVAEGQHEGVRASQHEVGAERGHA